MQEVVIQDQTFEIEQEYADHDFRTEIPNIVSELTLSHVAFRIYWVLKFIAGDKGKSWCSTRFLSEKCQCSEKSIERHLPELSVPFKELNNKPLIVIKKRFKENNSPDTNLITIVNIWPENGRFYRKKLKEKTPQNPNEGSAKSAPGGEKYSPGVATNCRQGGSDKLSPGVATNCRQGGDKLSPKQRNSEQGLCLKGQRLTEITESEDKISEPSVFSEVPEKSLPSFTKNNVPVSLPSSSKEGKKDWVKAMDQEAKAFHDFVISYTPPKGQRIESSFLTFMIKKFGLQRVRQAFDFCMMSIEKNGLKTSLGGLLRKAVENNWKAPDEKDEKCKMYAQLMAQRSSRLRVLEKYVTIEEMSWDYYYRDATSFEDFKAKLDAKLQYFESERNENAVGCNY